MPTFTDKVRRLDRARVALKRRYGEAVRTPVTHPVEHAVRAILSEEATSDEVDRALDRLRQYFVDMNDLRVSRPREIREVLGPNFPRGGHKARVIPRLLDQVFKQHNSMVWDFLEALGKVQTRAYFEKLEEVRPFVAAVLARDCVGAHAFPVDNDVARVLGRLAVLDPATQSETEMQAFLERAVKASRAYEIHWLVKRHGEQFCLVDTPPCGKCPLRRMCPSVVVPARGRGRAKAAKTPNAGRPSGQGAAAKKTAKPARRKTMPAGGNAAKRKRAVRRRAAPAPRSR
jgi:endonuclease-3